MNRLLTVTCVVATLLGLSGCAPTPQRVAGVDESTSALVTCQKREPLLGFDDFTVTFINITPGILSLQSSAIDCDRPKPTFLPGWALDNSNWDAGQNPSQFNGMVVAAGADSKPVHLKTTKVCRSVPMVGTFAFPNEWVMMMNYQVDGQKLTTELPMKITCRGSEKFDRVATMCRTQTAEIYKLPLYDAVTRQEQFAEFRVTQVCAAAGDGVTVTIEQSF